MGAMTDPAFAELRREFPVVAARAYLFAGGLAPLSAPGRAALAAYEELWTADPVTAYREYPRLQADLLRREVAALIRARPADVSIVDSTSRGNNLAVQMVPARPGANVVVDVTTYPSALAPWLSRGVEVRQAASADGIAGLVDERTAAISVSHVCRLTGFRHDLAALAEVAHAAGALLLVDAAQSVGAVRVDVGASGVDFLSFGAMKWLLGMPGIAFFYVGRDVQERLPPPHVAASEGAGARHELGSLAWPGLQATRAGLALLRRLPEETVERRLLELSGRLIDGLGKRGCRVHTPADPARRAGIVAFEADRPDALRAFLRERGVDVWGWEQRRLMRADPHVYNDEADLDRFFAALDAFA